MNVTIQATRLSPGNYTCTTHYIEGADGTVTATATTHPHSRATFTLELPLKSVMKALVKMPVHSRPRSGSATLTFNIKKNGKVEVTKIRKL